ncbi:MAG: hypothetical protein MJ069_08745 [Salinivirgaceae bacterium]|nr:hypothetical protein [Salinivirgaceae bacterium]
MEIDFQNEMNKLMNLFPNGFNAIDEPIDVNLQMEYFKTSKQVHKELDDDLNVDMLENINSETLSDEDRKVLLIKLASIDDARAFRIIEEYAKDTENPLHAWALMAKNESKMLIEGSLLNERQVFVSTGLGGRNNKLRYFVVLISNNEEFAEFQQKLVKSEFETAMKENQSELESIEFNGKYAATKLLIPLNVQFDKLIIDAVKTCNEFGNFLTHDFLVTNVKELSFEEIAEIVAQREKTGNTFTATPIDFIDEGNIGDELPDNE